MKICLISVEIFAWGKYGGFGRATRLIGRELAKRGIETCAVVPRRKGQQTREVLDGIEVYGFPPFNPFAAISFFKECDADIYHSCEPSFGTYLAMQAMPHKKHMVTFRDPRNLKDWWMELQRPSLSHLQVIHNFLYENNHLVRRSIPRMDAVYTIGEYLVPKVKKMYGLTRDPEFLPTPVEVPSGCRKACRPTVCYVARLDRRKRPELFLDLAGKFPEVRFIMMGKSRDRGYERYLREKYAALPNLEMVGFVDQFSSSLHSEILDRSWIMVNTATREALPNSFIEAASHQCALLSSVDPDSFASKFGYFAQEDDFERGLRYLLEEGRWREKGRKAHAYMKSTFELERSMNRHLAIYRQVAASAVPRQPLAARGRAAMTQAG